VPSLRQLAGLQILQMEFSLLRDMGYLDGIFPAVLPRVAVLYFQRVILVQDQIANRIRMRSPAPIVFFHPAYPLVDLQCDSFFSV